MAIIIERNQKIQSLQIIDNIYVCVCVCVCVCVRERDYTNLDVKTSKMPKRYIIKEYVCGRLQFRC